MKEKEKKPYGKAKVFGLSVLIFVLVLVLSTALLVCVTAHRHVYYDPIADAVASVPLEDTLVRLDDGQTVTLAKYINDNYIKSDRISEGQVRNILRNGDFNTRVGEKAGMIAQYIALRRSHPEDVSVPEITPEDIHYAIDFNESTIRLHTGLNDASVLEEPVKANTAADCEAFNKQLRGILTEGLSAVLIDAAVSRWIWYVLGGLLLLLLIWAVVVHAKGPGSAGTAFEVFAVAAGLPCLALMLWGLFSLYIFRWNNMAYLEYPVLYLRRVWFAIGGIGFMGCGVIFMFGKILGASKKKHAAPEAAAAPAEEPVPEQTAETAEEKPEEEAAAPELTRHYCRFCGKPLVNSDAMFCYKCGTKQAEIEKAKEKDTVS